MIGYVIGAVIVGYTAFIVYRKLKDIKEGKSCCQGCASCASCQSKKNCK